MVGTGKDYDKDVQLRAFEAQSKVIVAVKSAVDGLEMDGHPLVSSVAWSEASFIYDDLENSDKFDRRHQFFYFIDDNAIEFTKIVSFMVLFPFFFFIITIEHPD